MVWQRKSSCVSSWMVQQILRARDKCCRRCAVDLWNRHLWESTVRDPKPQTQMFLCSNTSPLWGFQYSIPAVPLNLQPESISNGNPVLNNTLLQKLELYPPQTACPSNSFLFPIAFPIPEWAKAELAVKARDCELGVWGLIPAQLLIYLRKTLYFSDLKNKVALLYVGT